MNYEMSEYDSWFDKMFSKMTRGMEDHQFKHYNHSMGCMIYNKEHYKHEMKQRRMIPYDVMEECAEQWDKTHQNHKYDSISKKAMDIIKATKLSADKHGNIKLGGIAIDALIEMGVIKGEREYTPTSTIGGFA